MGLLSITSVPVDRTHADVWVAAPDVQCVDLARPIPTGTTLARVAISQGGPAEPYLAGFAYWTKPGGKGSELCLVLGSYLEDNNLGTVDALTPELRAKLSEHGAVVVDESEMVRLGLSKVGDVGEIGGHRARVVGVVQGVKGLASPFIFCSVYTARDYLLPRGSELTSYVLVRCHDRTQGPALVERLNQGEQLSAFTAPDFSFRSACTG